MSRTQKILVIRFSSIGDIVLTTPVIRALHQQAGAEVHLLTKQSFAGVTGANPYISKVWAIQKKVGEVLPALRKERYTAIVDLHNNLRSRQVSLALWQTPCYRFDKLNFQKWLLTRWKINRMPDIHIVQRYLAAAQPLGISDDGMGLDHFIPLADQVNLAAAGLPKQYVAVVIGAAHATKRLPMELLVKLCQAISVPVLLMGGPDDQATAEAIAMRAGSHVV
ncbi:MAG: glycosyltransferase family 9 protein, partial [Saprospiraceae bacterium]